MLRFTSTRLIALVALLLSGCNALGGSPTPRTLSVSGTGTVERPPDLATVSLLIQTQGNSVGEAVSEHNRRSSTVQKAVSDLGVAASDIQTSYFSVSPQYHFDDQGRWTGSVSYWVESTLTVRLRALDRLGELLQSSINAGSTGVGSIAFGLADSSQDVLKARQMAIADAQRKAEALAELAGGQLGAMRSIDAGGSGPIPNVIGVGGGGGGVPVATGQTQIIQTVLVVYELR